MRATSLRVADALEEQAAGGVSGTQNLGRALGRIEPQVRHRPASSGPWQAKQWSEDRRVRRKEISAAGKAAAGNNRNRRRIRALLYSPRPEGDIARGNEAAAGKQTSAP